jgi:hypothetical protein
MYIIYHRFNQDIYGIGVDGIGGDQEHGSGIKGKSPRDFPRDKWVLTNCGSVAD